LDEASTVHLILLSKKTEQPNLFCSNSVTKQ
jgi:hypothetical protein